MESLDSAAPHPIDTTEWEELATHGRTKARFTIVGVLLILAAMASLATTGAAGPELLFPVTAGVGGLWLIYLATRPGDRHPFVRMLATRADDIETIYHHEIHVDGIYTSTLLTIATSTGEQARILVPRAEAAIWSTKLRATLPQANYRDEVPPPSWSG